MQLLFPHHSTLLPLPCLQCRIFLSTVSGSVQTLSIMMIFTSRDLRVWMAYWRFASVECVPSKIATRPSFASATHFRRSDNAASVAAAGTAFTGFASSESSSDSSSSESLESLLGGRDRLVSLETFAGGALVLKPELDDARSFRDVLQAFSASIIKRIKR